MIPIQHTEEVLSVSYVKAVVSHFGHTYSTIDNDYGTDGSVRKIKVIGNDYIDLGTKFDCQLKSTIDWEIVDNNIIYDMKVDAYNRLIIRNRESDTPCLLVLLFLPREKVNWINISTEQLAIKNCCYFYYLNGELTSNIDKKRIRIPTRNVFNQTNLQLLFDDFQKAVNYA